MRITPSLPMVKKPTQKVFHMRAVIGDHAIAGSVSFSPGSPFRHPDRAGRGSKAERILAHMLDEEIASGRL